MAFSIPAYEEIKAAILRDIANQLADAATDTASDFGVRAAAVGAAIEGLYQHQAFLERQIFPDSADTAYLERHAAFRGITRKRAITATGTALFSGTPSVAIALGTEAKTAAGLVFVTSEAGGIGADGTALVPVQGGAAGSAYNLIAETSLTLTSAPSGVQGTAVLASATAGGTDAETNAELLARLQTYMRTPPSGGTKADYERWALAVPGVSQAWCFPLRRGLGTVDVAVLGPEGIPEPEVLAAVLTAIESARPVACRSVHVYAPTPLVIPVTVQVSLANGTTGFEAALNTALQTYFIALKPGSAVLRSQLISLASGLAGLMDLALAAPAVSVQTRADAESLQLPVLGQVTVEAL